MSLKIQFDREDLRPLIHLAVAEARGQQLLGQFGPVLGNGSDNG